MGPSQPTTRPVSTALLFCFFFNDTATTEIYPLSLHDALPISGLQALTRHLGKDAGDVYQLAAGKYVFVHEIADTAAELGVLQRIGRDAVVHDHPAQIGRAHV